MNGSRTRAGHRFASWQVCSLAVLWFAALASPASAQMTGFTKIYNTGLLPAGSDEVSQQVVVSFVNNNNVPDPALPSLAASEEACTCVAQFLDANGNTLQKQRQTLQPGQNFSFSMGMNQAVQARVDISPGTTSGFAPIVTDQCAVSAEILDTSLNEPVAFPPLSSTRVAGPLGTCEDGCVQNCALRSKHDRGACLDLCRRGCRL